MGLFDNLNSATGKQGGNYLRPGVYQVSINKCATIHTRAKKDAFVMNFTVVASSPVEPGQDPHPGAKYVNESMGDAQKILYATHMELVRIS